MSYIIQDIITENGISFGIEDSNRVNTITKYEAIDFLNKQEKNDKNIVFVLPKESADIIIVFQIEEKIIKSDKLKISHASKNGLEFINIDLPSKEFYKFYKIKLTSEKSIGDSKYTVTVKNLGIEMAKRLSIKYLLVYKDEYYYINDYIKKLGKPKNNDELIQWYRLYGIDDLNIILEKVKERNINFSLCNKYYKTNKQLDFNEVTGKIKFVGQTIQKVFFSSNECPMIDIIKEKLNPEIKIYKFEEEQKWLNS